ncbi:hypothetical protein D4R78_05235 [bacterium]|nr:MAG: hypothetical protein D4R78_05235 [bacterium]
MSEAKPVLRVAEKEYGQEYRSHLLAQYQLYVESAEKISDRRQNANNYFITINTVLVSFLGALFQVKLFGNILWVKSLIPVIGIIICVIFWYLLRSYKQLNTGKFKVIHEIEQRLPLALYDYEWHVLKEGKDKKTYYPFSHIEMIIPWVFGVIYLILAIIFSIIRC